jgi:hypothetical protein
MSIPANIIIAWSGAINEIPDSWFLCDGENNTPNLKNRFIVCAGSSYALNATGGNADAILISHTHSASSISTIGSHTHTVSGRDNIGGSAVLGCYGNATTQTNFDVSTSGGGEHNHDVSTSEEGESPTNKNLPPYYALAFIMKGAE